MEKNGENVDISQGSEWNELMYRVSSDNPNGTSENFAMYTDTQLNIASGCGRFTWCQEQYGVGSTNRVIHGNNSVDNLNANTSSSITGMGWRPVLELIK